VTSKIKLRKRSEKSAVLIAGQCVYKVNERRVKSHRETREFFAPAEFDVSRSPAGASAVIDLIDDAAHLRLSNTIWTKSGIFWIIAPLLRHE
jgi:hypothetical protein